MTRLDWRSKQEVNYAVPLWLRDEQIKHAIARVNGRVTPHEGAPHTESIAVVGFGPSLVDTWEQVRAFGKVVSCSGSHKYLIERGIVPTWHVEVDPRAHKISLLGDPHPDVTYLVSSTCCPEYFDHLEKGLGERFTTNVLLWHVFDSTEEGIRTLPAGEWAVTGGCDVGLRAIALAAFLGYRDIHIFGIDGSAKGDDRHAATHPHGKQKYAEVEYPDNSGRLWLTTPAMLEAARQTRHELEQMPNVRPTFHGDGLTQAMMADYVPSGESKGAILGVQKPELISAGYRELNARLHRENMAYGVGGEKHAQVIADICARLRTKDVLDYGCGKGRLGRSLPFHVQEYDPAVPGKEESPKPADIVVCTDVLEHIEPDKLGFVLGDLRRCVRQVGYFVIHTGPAAKTLADGRNTHLIQKDKQWWEKHLRKFFKVGKIVMKGAEIHAIVGPKDASKPKPAVATVAA